MTTAFCIWHEMANIFPCISSVWIALSLFSSFILLCELMMVVAFLVVSNDSIEAWTKVDMNNGKKNGKSWTTFWNGAQNERRIFETRDNRSRIYKMKLAWLFELLDTIKVHRSNAFAFLNDPLFEHYTFYLFNTVCEFPWLANANTFNPILPREHFSTS